MHNKFLLFTKENCIPCGMVKKYINSLSKKFESFSLIQEIDIDENISPKENFDIAERYNVFFSPHLVIIDSDKNLIHEEKGGMKITQNLRRLLDQYAQS